MTKKRIILLTFTILIVFSLVFTAAANPWKARFKVRNQTEQDIIIILVPIEEEGEYYSQLVVPAYNVEDENEAARAIKDIEELRENQSTKFTIERSLYEAEVFACGMRAKGTIDLTRNLKLNFTPCEDMAEYWRKKYHGEPSMEKPNWFKGPGMSEWRFVYGVPPESLDWEYVDDLD